MNIISFRWWLFSRLSALGWMVCPEPYRSHLKASISFDNVMWDDPDRAFAEYITGRLARVSTQEG